MTTRTERDPLGERAVPADAYYGIQTARAIENFPISGLRAPALLVDATVLVKKAAALCQRDARAPRRAHRERHHLRPLTRSLAARLREQFVVDVYQAGAGTSHNMNANEVIANRAAELLGGVRGEYRLVHPNDHVNMGQSTNDVYPTATRLALLLGHGDLLLAARALATALDDQGAGVRPRVESRADAPAGRSADDAGQEFSGYAACINHGASALDRTSSQLQELNLGATAVGTGLNAGDDYTSLAIGFLSRLSALTLKPAENRFRVTQSMGDVLAYSGTMRRLAVELGKVASDLRLLSMGPRAGHRRDHAAGRPARLVHHAGQGEPVDSGNGEPGLLPGDRL